MNYRTIRISNRYSAFLAAQNLRVAKRLGANITNSDIRQAVIAQYGW